MQKAELHVAMLRLMLLRSKRQLGMANVDSGFTVTGMAMWIPGSRY